MKRKYFFDQYLTLKKALRNKRTRHVSVRFARLLERRLSLIFQFIGSSQIIQKQFHKKLKKFFFFKLLETNVFITKVNNEIEKQWKKVNLKL